MNKKMIALVLLVAILATVVVPTSPALAQGGGWCLDQNSGAWMDCNLLYPPTPEPASYSGCFWEGYLMDPCPTWAIETSTMAPSAYGAYNPVTQPPAQQYPAGCWKNGSQYPTESPQCSSGGSGWDVVAWPPPSPVSTETVGWTVLGEEIKINWFVLNFNGPIFLSTTASTGNPASAVVAAVAAGSIVVWYAYQTQPVDIPWGEWLMGGVSELRSSWPKTKWAMTTTSTAGNPASAAPTLDFASTMEANWWYSKNHQESNEAIAGLAALTSGNELWSRGDGRSSGSVEIWVGVDQMNNATAGIAHIVGSYVDYVAIRFPVYLIAGGVIPPGAKQLTQGSPWYYFPSEVGPISMGNPKVTCSWRLSGSIGHGAQAPLEVGRGGYDRWLDLRARYGLNISLAVLYLGG